MMIGRMGVMLDSDCGGGRNNQLSLLDDKFMDQHWSWRGRILRGQYRREEAG
jgi:hypothetical protein